MLTNIKTGEKFNMKKNTFNREFHINPYQRPIILMSLVPLLIVCVLLTAFLTVFFRDLENLIIYGNVMAMPDFLQKWIILLVGFVWAFFVVNFIVAHRVSLNLVGAFERIIHELDENLKEDKSSKLHCRNKDILASELIARINRLIDKIPGSNK